MRRYKFKKIVGGWRVNRPTTLAPGIAVFDISHLTGYAIYLPQRHSQYEKFGETCSSTSLKSHRKGGIGTSPVTTTTVCLFRGMDTRWACVC